MLYLLLMVIVWGLEFAAMTLAVIALAAAYRIGRAKMGLESWPRELVLWMALTLIQAGVFLVLCFLPWIPSRLLIAPHLALGFATAAIGCRLAHPRSMMQTPTVLLVAAAQQAVFVPLWWPVLHWLASG